MAPKSKAKSRSRGASGAKAKAKAKANATAKAGTPVWSPQDLAAMQVQAAARGFLGRLLLATCRRQQAEMEEAIRESEAAALRADRRRQEAARKKDQAKREKAKNLVKDTQALLGVAFDGEVAAVEKLLSQGVPVDAQDVNGTTALSEAASGGSLEATQLLLNSKADPNTQGEFKRSPLWRAAYASHQGIVQLLLETGADPRIADSQGEAPVDIASQDEILAFLRSWDISRTDELVEDYRSWFEDQRLEEEFRQREAMRSVDGEYDAAKTANSAAQMMLAKAKARFRETEKEVGVRLAAGHETAKMACEGAHQQVEIAEADAQAAQQRLDKANIARLAAAEESGVDLKLPGREIDVASLNDVLCRDLGGRIAKGSQWPLVVDPNDLAKKLLFYSGCSVLSFFKADEMQPERLRKSLLTMIRAGGVLAIDLFCFSAGVDLSLLSEPFNQLRPSLLDDICSRKLLSKAAGAPRHVFYELVTKEESKDSFRMEVFDDDKIARFKFMVLTSIDLPNQELMDNFDVLRVSPNAA